MSRPKPEPTNRTPARVSCRIVSSTAAGPASHAWLLAVLTTSNPARASAAAAAAGAVNTPTESGAALESGAIGLSRFPKVMSAAASESRSARNGERVSPSSNRSFARRRPRLISPTAYRRSVSVGCCSSPRCRLHDTTWTESRSTPITKPSFEPSTAYHPGEPLSRVHEAGSRARSIRVAVEKLDAPPEQRLRGRVRNRAELRLGSGNVEPAQSHHTDAGRERRA